MNASNGLSHELSRAFPFWFQEVVIIKVQQITDYANRAFWNSFWIVIICYTHTCTQTHRTKNNASTAGMMPCLWNQYAKLHGESIQKPLRSENEV